MASRGSYQHRKAIVDYLAELTSQGYKTINLNCFSPDGIAVKDGKIIAVEVLIIGKSSSHSANSKRSQYSMFDEVYVKKVKRDYSYDDNRKLEEERMYQNVRKLRDEEKISDMWNRYG